MVSPGPKKTIGKKAATLKKAATPPLTKMCAEAILSLKDRTGSSRHAIKAYILAKYGREFEEAALTAALTTKWFVKNKGSFKFSDEGKEHFQKMAKKMRY